MLEMVLFVLFRSVNYTDPFQYNRHLPLGLSERKLSEMDLGAEICFRKLTKFQTAATDGFSPFSFGFDCLDE